MNAIRPQFVDFIPQTLVPGVLYITERYRTASHLCACGCGSKVVTPFSPADWRMVRQGDRVSLYPSIGNWNYACRSHYWIKNNAIVWSGSMTSARIARVQERDRLDKARHVEQRNRHKVATAADEQGMLAGDERSSWWTRALAAIAALLSK